MFINFFRIFLLQHMVQGGVGPFHQAAPTFQQAPTVTAESLSVAVAVKNEQIAASHKQDIGGGGGGGAPPPQQTPGSQVNIKAKLIYHNMCVYNRSLDGHFARWTAIKARCFRKL